MSSISNLWKSSERQQDTSEEAKPFQESTLPLIKTKQNPIRLALYGLATISALLVGFAIIHSNFSTSQKSSSVNPRPCGNSSAEARANGCTFDQLLWSWIPPNCPHYNNDDFKAFEDWKYYVGKDGKKEVKVDGGDDWEKVLNNELDVYGANGEHLTHCVFMLLGMAKIVTEGLPTIPKMTEYPHLEHCAHHILKALKDIPDFNKLNSLAPYVNYKQTCQ